MKESELFKAVSYDFAAPEEFFQQRLMKYEIAFSPKSIVEIGGSTSRNISKVYPGGKYLNLDIAPNAAIPTQLCDVNQGIPLDVNSVTLAYSNNTFEHLEKPWKVAEEIHRILEPGGYCFVSTIFAWRYHPVPDDFWRFTHHGLKSIFEKMHCLECNFNIAPRRNDVRGFWENGYDHVPVDDLGGWRENWGVYFLGKKS